MAKTLREFIYKKNSSCYVPLSLECFVMIFLNIKLCTSSYADFFRPQHHVNMFPEIQFPCTVEASSDTIPRSVHELRASDISVVAAFGDSLTSGCGIDADSLLDVNTYRGHSWSIGGEDTYEQGVTTFPNILKHYSSNLTGYAVGTGPVENAVSRLNLAIPGMSQNSVEKNSDFHRKLTWEVSSWVPGAG